MTPSLWQLFKQAPHRLNGDQVQQLIADADPSVEQVILTRWHQACFDHASTKTVAAAPAPTATGTLTKLHLPSHVLVGLRGHETYATRLIDGLKDQGWTTDKIQQALEWSAAYLRGSQRR